MKPEILKEYEHRLREHLMWFEHKAMTAKKKFLLLRMLQTLILAILPILFLFPNYLDNFSFSISLLGGVLSMLALVITSLMQISNFDSQWQQYRLIIEQVHREQLSFRMEMGEYSRLDEEERIRSYIERVESIINSERSKWFVGEKRGDRL